VHAVQGVDLDLAAGQLVALTGANGSGKSTLLRTLGGELGPTAGALRVGNGWVKRWDVKRALSRGVVLVAAGVNTLVGFTASEYVRLFLQGAQHWVSERSASVVPSIARVFSDLDRNFGVTLHPDVRLADLSVRDQALLRLAVASSIQPSILLLDEPTTNLSPHDKDALLESLAHTQRSGTAILAATHDWTLVSQADLHVTMSDGSISATSDTAPAHYPSARHVRTTIPGDFVRLRASRVSTAHMPAVTETLDAGEAHVVTGLSDATRRFIECITGVEPFIDGCLTINGREIRCGRRWSSVRAGLARVSGDRNVSSVFPDLSIEENVLVGCSSVQGLFDVGSLRRNRLRLHALIDQFGVHPANYALPAAVLSSGNQQKVALARALGAGAMIWVLEEPQMNLDGNALARLVQRVADFLDEGGSVLLAGEDITPLLHLSSGDCVIPHE
jgi:ABC-type sugar transport system ATPase subunit